MENLKTTSYVLWGIKKVMGSVTMFILRYFSFCFWLKKKLFSIIFILAVYWKAPVQIAFDEFFAFFYSE